MHSDLVRRDVPLEKIVSYLLNDRHPEGRSKATFFRAFGFDERRPQELQVALHDHPARNPVAGTKETLYGSKLVVRCTMETPDGRNPCVVSVWMVREEIPAQFVTAYPA